MAATRRGVLAGLACAFVAEPAQAKAGTLVFAQEAEPLVLTAALTTAAPTSFISTKIFEGLLAVDERSRPRPQLAQEWSASPDGLSFTFHLRRGVTWHDGKSFTSADVAFSAMEIWKKYHGRGRATFANLQTVETPSPLTAIFRLSRPAPYLISALTAQESPVMPRHLYDKGDILSNPHNIAPVGTGPFRFAAWQRGNAITLTRNPRYWDAGKPFLDGIIVRFLSGEEAIAIALETGAVDLAQTVPLRQLQRLAALPSLRLLPRLNVYSPTLYQFEFNLDRPALRDARVRRAFAHAIDRAFIARNIWLGTAMPADSPVPVGMLGFHAKNLPAYPFDLKRAEQLLDQAGLRRDDEGIRLRLSHDFSQTQINTRTAAFIRGSLARVGVALQLRPQDAGQYVNRVYTRRDFDTCMTGSGAGPDPAIGVQRYYWSKNFQRGVAFSNGAHYANPAADKLLEAAQIEADPARRRDLYNRFQHLAMTDLPYLPLVSARQVIVARRRVQNLPVDSTGLYSNFATVVAA